MGWVEDLFVERIALGRGLEPFWNTVRDSVGRSAMEYNDRVTNLQGAATFRVRDCQAGGMRYCLRVVKVTDESWIELFLDTAEQSFQSLQADRNLSTVCRYRLGAGGIEFYIDTDEGPSVLSTEDACKRALHDFIMKPFPTVFRDGAQFVEPR